MSHWRRELQRLHASPLFRNTGWMVAGQGTGFVLQAVYFVALARLLGATQYGIFAGAFAFTSIAAQYSSLGSGVVLIRYVSGEQKVFAAYWGNILLATCIVSAVLIVGLSFFAPHLLNPYSAALVPLAAIANCFAGQLTMETARVFQAFEQLRITAVLNLLTNLLRALVVIAMLLVLHHATAWQWAIASTIVTLLGAALAVGNVTARFGLPKFKAEIFRKHILEGFGYSFAGSTTVFYNDVDKTMLSHYGMNLANGIYSMAYRVVDIASIPITAINAASISQFFQRGRAGVSSAAELSNRLLKRAFPVSIVMSVAMFAAAPLIPRIAGQGFMQSVSALRWLCLIPVFRGVQTITGSALTGAGYQTYRTAAQVAAASLNLGLNLWLIPIYGWQGAAWSSLATDATVGAMNWIILNILVRSERNSDLQSLLKRLQQMPMHRIPSRLAKRSAVLTQLAWLRLVNKYGRHTITRPNGPVLSLTTYGKRIHSVHYTIESIGRGKLLPSRIILWLDDRALFDNLPATLRRLQKRGLEVRLSQNYGPHTKYYPYIDSAETFDLPLVTADDDTLYSRDWMQRLVSDFRKYPEYVNCHLAKVVVLKKGRISQYSEWPMCRSTTPSFRNVANGVSGVIYPIKVLEAFKEAGTGFQSCCPKADDLWLHVQTIRAGFKIRQIRHRARRFALIPGTQEMGLWHENYRTGNDLQASATYTETDIRVMQQC
jgi:O-antigen/teichoic acid export membrane protein